MHLVPKSSHFWHSGWSTRNSLKTRLPRQFRTEEDQRKPAWDSRRRQTCLRWRALGNRFASEPFLGNCQTGTSLHRTVFSAAAARRLAPGSSSWKTCPEKQTPADGRSRTWCLVCPWMPLVCTPFAAGRGSRSAPGLLLHSPPVWQSDCFVQVFECGKSRLMTVSRKFLVQLSFVSCYNSLRSWSCSFNGWGGDKIIK